MTTMTKLLGATGFPYRTAGWAAIASGTLGILAHAALLAAVFSRTSWEVSGQVLHLFSLHNGIAILQFLLMIAAVISLYRLSNNESTGMSQATLITGVLTLSITALFLLFIFPKVMSDSYYMIPQAMFGIWLVIVNWQLSGILPRGLRWFGMIVGVGLLLVGLSVIGYAIFVDSIGLHIPAVDQNKTEDPGATTANIIVHNILFIGSFMGVLTLPFWTILLGRKLIREREGQLAMGN